MPNWCHNKLYVSGDSAGLDAFAEAVRSDEQALSFEKILPTPAKMLEAKNPKQGMPDWYNWRCDHWGTKWDASPDGMDVDETDDGLLYRFDTAWSPPAPIVGVMASQHPGLKFTLEFGEPGMEAAGRFTYTAGQADGYEDLELSDVLGPEEMWF